MRVSRTSQSPATEAALPLFERERELSKLLQSIRQEKPALVCGSPGMGKTRLLLELRGSLKGEGMPVLYVPFVQPLHAFLTRIAAQLSLKGHGDSSVVLRGLLWTALESSPRIILLDGIAKPSLLFYRFFERLLYVPGMALIGSAAQPYATGALHRVFWNQQTIFSLRPLGKEASAALARKAIEAFAPDLADDSAFLEQVIQVARGNPGRIVEMCKRVADPAYRDGDRIRFAALSIDAFTRLVS